MDMDLTRGNSLLNTLPHKVQAELRDKAFTQRYQNKEQITRQEEPNSDVFVIIYGTARVIVYSETGVKLTFTDIKAGEYFGELAAIDGRPRSATVMAIEETLVTRIPAEKFDQFIVLYPDFSKFVMRNLCGMIRRLNHRIYEFTTLKVRHRIHSELLRIAERLPIEANQAIQFMPPTHAEIAARISTHREAVTREYKKLRLAGLIEKRSKQLVFRDVEGLRKLVLKNSSGK